MKTWAKDIFLAGLLIMAAVPAFAHHGNAAIDNTKQVTVTGTITDWVWANPHSWLKVDVKNDSGEVEHWVFEAESKKTLRALRLQHQLLAMTCREFGSRRTGGATGSKRLGRRRTLARETYFSYDAPRRADVQSQ
jgi:hypothetical protein